MTPLQLRSIISKLGFSQEGLGRFLKHKTGRQVRRWVAGESDIPEAVSLLLRLMAKVGVTKSDFDEYW